MRLARLSKLASVFDVANCQSSMVTLTWAKDWDKPGSNSVKCCLSQLAIDTGDIELCLRSRQARLSKLAKRCSSLACVPMCECQPCHIYWLSILSRGYKDIEDNYSLSGPPLKLSTAVHGIIVPDIALHGIAWPDIALHGSASNASKRNCIAWHC